MRNKRALDGKNFIIILVIQPIRTSIITQQKRFRSKINIQKPRKPHFERAKVERFTKPFIANPDTNLPLWDRCARIANVTEKKEAHPYEKIIARECLNWIKTSNMIAIFHANSVKQMQLFNFAVPLKRANMYFKGYQTSILKVALKDTPYEALLHLKHPMRVPTYFVFSPETDTNKLFKIAKKTPQLILLAGVLHGKLLSRNEFLEYGKLDLVTAQAGLVQVLRAASGGNLNQQLTHHQSTLVTRLKQIGTKEEEDKPCDAK